MSLDVKYHLESIKVCSFARTLKSLEKFKPPLLRAYSLLHPSFDPEMRVP